jgi:predicted Zn-dependent protease
MSKRPPPPSSAGRPSAIDQVLDRAAMALQMQRPDEAERIAGDVLKANRGNVRAAQLLGHALLMQNRAAEAITPLERAARRSDDPTTKTLYAAALAQSGFSEEALKQIRQLTVRRPLFPPAYLEHAGQLVQAGRFAEAIAILDDGLAQMPDSIDLQRELAALHVKRNDRARARELLLRALKGAPERVDLLTGLAHVMLLDGEYAEAADMFKRVLGLRPDDAVARADLGRCLLELGQREAGEAHIRAASHERPQMLGRSVMSLAMSSRGRFFLRRSAAEKFLRGEKN